MILEFLSLRMFVTTSPVPICKSSKGSSDDSFVYGSFSARRLMRVQPLVSRSSADMDDGDFVLMGVLSWF